MGRLLRPVYEAKMEDALPFPLNIRRLLWASRFALVTFPISFWRDSGGGVVSTIFAVFAWCWLLLGHESLRWCIKYHTRKAQIEAWWKKTGYYTESLVRDAHLQVMTHANIMQELIKMWASKQKPKDHGKTP